MVAHGKEFLISVDILTFEGASFVVYIFFNSACMNVQKPNSLSSSTFMTEYTKIQIYS